MLSVISEYFDVNERRHKSKCPMLSLKLGIVFFLFCFSLTGVASQPSIQSVTGPAAGYYDNNDNLEFVVSFSGAIQVDSDASLQLDVSGEEEAGDHGFLVLALDSGNAYAQFQRISGTDVIFSYTPTHQDFDLDGVALAGFQDFKVTNGAGQAANLNLEDVNPLPAIKIVHGNTANLPPEGNYQPGDKLVYTLRWGRVTSIAMAGGAPQLAIEIGNNEYLLEAESSNQGEIRFTHILTESDDVSNGITVGNLNLNNTIFIGTLDGRNDYSSGSHELTVSNTSFVNNGLIKVTALGNDASEVLVGRSAVPKVTHVDVPASGDYLIGNTLSFTVHFDQKVLSTNTDNTELNISLDNGREVKASYVSDSGEQTHWQFDYVITPLDKAANGIALMNMTSSGQYYDEGANFAFSNWQDLNLQNIADSSGISLNMANTASIVRVTVPYAKTYVAGDSLNITLHYSQDVVVDGTPLLYLTIGGTQVVAEYVSGSGTSALIFNYVLAPGLENFKGISVDELVLNGATVLSSTGVAADEQLTNLDDQPPVFAQPQDLEINATGLLTSVSDLVVPTAHDALDGDVEVHLDSSIESHLMPGHHELIWYAVDAAGNRSEARQSLSIHPLISISPDQTQAEGAESRVQVILNGEPPEYPLTVSFGVSGNATGPGVEDEDHTLSSGSITFVESDFEENDFEQSDSEPNGSEQRMFSKDITFVIHEDTRSEGNETIEVNLIGSGNFGNKTSHITTITESNVAPSITLKVSQNDSNVLIIEQGSGLVDFTAMVSDSNLNDQHTLEWEFSNGVTPIVVNELQRQIEPSGIVPGTYSVTVAVNDNGSPSLSNVTSLTYRIVDELRTLTSQDSDGDGISDLVEGFADDDQDGQPNYLDPVAMDNVISETSEDGLAFLIESDPGLKMMLGERALANGGYGAQLNLEQLPERLKISADSVTNVSGYFDFVVNGLTESGQSVNVVLPQRAAIPADAVYRKFGDGVWFDFVEDAGNEVMSAPGSEGSCPSPQSSAYRTGLNEGDWCVQLTIEDGGPNDADGVANGRIHDPGGVGTTASDSNNVSNSDNTDTSKKSSGGAIGFMLLLLLSLMNIRWVASVCSVPPLGRRD
ncbi:choice-of-anchor U domain-containing protein [Litoribacillus peritrichatus]|uniref:Uncharacterized protein n=1 Tax=Litoribacillus peritrichatus TaxID=718191 RepID=A0ABP7N6W9_9GAMM